MGNQLIFTFKVVNNHLDKQFTCPFTAETLESAQELAEGLIDSMNYRGKIFVEGKGLVPQMEILGITSITRAS